MKSPFPWPGGKSRVADLVWDRLGNVSNFIEPFAGSLAVLMRRPAEHFAGGYRVETVNDADHFIVNFWRAVANDPEAVARWADNPVLEADLHARHKWLMRSEFAADWRKRMAEDPDHYDAKIAGFWCWGICCWIGSGWCSGSNSAQIPVLNHHSGLPGKGVNNYHMPDRQGRPQLADAFDIGRGVNSGGGLSQKIPMLNGGGHGWQPGVNREGPGTCDARRAWLTDWMRRLADRLRLVRTCYGHWSRICDSDSTLTRLGTTGVFLDPPYPTQTAKGTRAKGLYSNDGQDLDQLRDEVLAWCRKWGQDRMIRVAVCGYEGDGYEALIAEGWTEESWEASGGYGNQRKSKKGKAENAKRERIWFSPACVAERGLFDELH